MIDFSKCENVLGYKFNDRSLLVKAFTHSSYSNEHKEMKNNERLEFFGDSILGFIVTEYLFEKYSKTDEGQMTKLKQNIVSKRPLSKASIRAGFDEFLLLGEGEKKNFEKAKESLCENLFESIVAAIYLDGGIESAKKFIYEKLINLTENLHDNVDYKGKLQELVHKRKLGEIKYVLNCVEGPAHKPTFSVSLIINDRLVTTAHASSKQKAQQQCAMIAINKL